MKVFISWSGDTGKAIAEIVYWWLPTVIQAVKPYFSPDEIAKGARWSSEIAKELDASQVGLLIVTRDNLEAPWLMFEAGALSKNIGKSKVAPLLFDIEPSAIRGPLVQFQAARFERAEMKRVLRMINSELGDSALTNDVLDSAFNMWWPQLEQAVRIVLEHADYRSVTIDRSEREILLEVLTLARSLVQRENDLRKSGNVHAPDVSEAIRKGASLSRAEVSVRLKSGGNLAGANLMGADLHGVDLSGADMRGASLVDADLKGARLVNANLKGANLERTELSGADLQGADISCVNFWGAVMDNLQNLAKVSSLELSNFHDVLFLGEADKEFISQNNTLSIADYVSFFEYFQTKQGMNKSEISDLFLWTAHPDFAGFLAGLSDTR